MFFQILQKLCLFIDEKSLLTFTITHTKSMFEWSNWSSSVGIFETLSGSDKVWRKKPSKASKKCQYNSPSKIAFRPPSRAAQLRRLTKIYCHQKRLFLLCGQLHKMGLSLTLIRRRCFVTMKCTQCNAHLKAKPICRGRPKNRTVAHWIFSQEKRALNNF